MTSRIGKVTVVIASAVGAVLIALALATNAFAHLYGFSFDRYWSGKCDNVCFDSQVHTYGFHSADYDGSGNLEVCTAARKISDSPGSFGRLLYQACGNRLARDCYHIRQYYPHCGDQDGSLYHHYMLQGHLGHAHTLYGHAEA